MTDDPGNILLFGGTFDPVHRGHIAMARAVVNAHGGDRVVLIPSRQPPHKQGVLAPPKDRVAMLELAILGDGLFEVDEIELTRDGPSYTIDTVLALRERYGSGVRLAWLIGADMLAELPQWYRSAELVTLIDFVIALREPWHDRLPEIFASFSPTFSPAVIESLRANVVETPLIDISSTAVREAVRRGEPIDAWVTPSVADYITSHHLYQV